MGCGLVVGLGGAVKVSSLVISFSFEGRGGSERCFADYFWGIVIYDAYRVN